MMKIKSTPLWATASSGIAVLAVGAAIYTMNSVDNEEYRNDFHHIEKNTYLASPVDTKSLNEIYGKGGENIARYWLIGQSPDDKKKSRFIR